MSLSLEDENIVIIKTKLSDLDRISALEVIPENQKYIIPHSKEENLRLINSKDELHLSIYLKPTYQLCGFIILAGINNVNNCIELKRIVIETKGKGIGRKSIRLIKKYIFNTLKAQRLWLDVFDYNLVALKLYRSEGFKEEGILRQVIKEDKPYKSLIIMSILAQEYQLYEI